MKHYSRWFININEKKSGWYFNPLFFLLPDSFIFLWEENSICPSSGAFWVENALPKENYIASLANSSYLSCQEINHALASLRREGQASLHMWESKLATFVLLWMKKVGVRDWQTALEVGAASEKVGVRATQTLQMTREERRAGAIWKAKTPSGCYYSNREDCHTLWSSFLAETVDQGSVTGRTPKSFSRSNRLMGVLFTVAEPINVKNNLKKDTKEGVVQWFRFS